MGDGLKGQARHKFLILKSNNSQAQRLSIGIACY